MSTEFYWVAVTVVTILSAARLTRLANIDKFPPTAAIRHWYQEKNEFNDWIWLTLCAYCMAPWMTLFVGAWGWLAGVYGNTPLIEDNISALIWWGFNGWLAASYLAGSFVAHDSGSDDD